MQLSGEAKIILGSVMFALIPLCVKLSPGVGIEALLFGRLFFASLVFFIGFKDRAHIFTIPKRDFIMLIIWSGIMSAAMLCYFYAIRLCGAAISSALLGIQPVVIIFLAYVFLKEVISNTSILAGILSLIGVYFISDLSTSIPGSNILTGEILAIASAVLLAFNFIYQKKYLSHYSSQKLVFYQSVFQLPFFAPFIIGDSKYMSVDFILASFTLGIFCTVIAYTLIYKGASETDAQKIGVLQCVEFVLPVLIGYCMFNESLDLYKLIGILLIIAACLCISYKPSNALLRKRSSH